jgi:hypothetical protein
VIPIVWGEPDREASQAAERGELVTGGCFVAPENPTWRCKACGEDFGRLGDDPIYFGEGADG